MRITLLGVGSSAGTPVIGCRCKVCLSQHPKNKRTRCSALVTFPAGQQLLIDTGPDLRQQAIREGISRVDAVLYTHTHADHLHGIDDLRAFCQMQRRQIPLFGNPATMAHIQQKFGYAIRSPSDFWDIPVLSLNEVTQPFELFGQTITPIPILHGRSEILGYRIGDMAYITDVSEIPEASFRLLENLSVLFLDCLRYTPHYTHIHLEQSLAYAGQIKADSTFLIHMTHEIDYESQEITLPNGVALGFDGLTMDFSPSGRLTP